MYSLRPVTVSAIAWIFNKTFENKGIAEDSFEHVTLQVNANLVTSTQQEDEDNPHACGYGT